ncbi:hypothetical protein CDD83_1809 [Cordyceps sp. RAO-2017]|nr:hypothetical protein CDD83_1809 [Cordyceps sp. RAO-2017]
MTQPSPAAVGAVYDQFTDFFADLLGGCIHFGYWDDADDGQTVRAATDQLTGLVAGRLALRPGQHILDVGCGSGKPAMQIATAHDVRVTGVTVSNRQIELARAQPGGVEQLGQVCFQLADAMDLPFADGTFDGAYAIESLVHMHDKSAALANIARVLRPGGRLVVADMFLDEPPSGGHDAQALASICRLFQISVILTVDEYRRLLHQAGLHVVDFADVRHNVLPTYGIVAEALRQKALCLDGELGEQMRAGASDIEHMGTMTELGYALIVASRA